MKTYKIILVGDSAVGKTNLLTQYVDEKFSPNNISTIGIEFKNKIIKLDNETQFRLQIWDTSGQEKFMSLTKNYFRGCDIALFVFDVTNKVSFENISTWLNLYDSIGDVNSIKILIGNKIDLKNRVIDKEVANKFANENRLKYFEISTKENKDKAIDDMFVEIVKEFLKIQNEKKNNFLDNNENIEHKDIPSNQFMGPNKRVKNNDLRNNNSGRRNRRNNCC